MLLIFLIRYFIENFSELLKTQNLCSKIYYATETCNEVIWKIL